MWNNIIIHYLYCNEIYTKLQDEQLYDAVDRNNISDVEKLLKNNANPNSHHTYREVCKSYTYNYIIYMSVIIHKLLFTYMC